LLFYLIILSASFLITISIGSLAARTTGLALGATHRVAGGGSSRPQLLIFPWWWWWGARRETLLSLSTFLYQPSSTSSGGCDLDFA